MDRERACDGEEKARPQAQVETREIPVHATSWKEDRWDGTVQGPRDHIGLLSFTSP